MQVDWLLISNEHSEKRAPKQYLWCTFATNDALYIVACQQGAVSDKPPHSEKKGAETAPLGVLFGLVITTQQKLKKIRTDSTLDPFY